MRDYPKAIKRLIRQWAAIAHEREMRVHLEQLAASFARWQAGEVETWDLTDAIHQFHQGPNRDLFNRYTGPYPDLAVAHALVEGLVQEAELPAELVAALAPAITLYRGVPLVEEETA